MKVVINDCHGGFGLSDEAFELLLNKKGIEFESQPRKVWNSKEYYRKGHLDDNYYYLSHYDLCADRADPDLVGVVEELGEAAYGECAELSVIEVPDDVQWHIVEYDGFEHVAENHRIWR